MKLDEDGLVIMEQDHTLQAATGDSCAETGRLSTLQAVLKIPVSSHLHSLVSANGVVRYPNLWPASQTSSDQVIPLLPALENSIVDYSLLKMVLNDLKNFRTGDGNWITALLFCQMQRAKNCPYCWLSDIFIFLQSLVFLLPIRWSDSERCFVSSYASTADYLNFVNTLAYARLKKWTFFCWLATIFCKQSKALQAIQSYYKPEPNSQWLIGLYEKALPLIWKNG